MVKDWGNITFAEGYGDPEDVTDEALIAEAVEKAGKAKAAVIFAGLPDAFESEGFDRSHMGMPNCQNELINQMCIRDSLPAFPGICGGSAASSEAAGRKREPCGLRSSVVRVSSLRSGRRARRNYAGPEICIQGCRSLLFCGTGTVPMLSLIHI